MHHEIWHERLWAFACISCGPRPEALVIDGIAMGLKVQELNKYKEEFCIDQRYAPQIFAQIFAVILAQRSKYHKYWRKYLRRKKRKFTHRKYLRKYLRKYWCNAKNTQNIGANICGEKSENICTANICANICANIGATHKIPQILAHIFAAKKAKIYAPQIFAQIFAQIFTEKKAKNTYGYLLDNFFLFSQKTFQNKDFITR